MELVSEKQMNEFRKKNGQSESDVQNLFTTLEEWYKKQTHFPRTSCDEQFLLRFLYAAKFNLERSKLVIENYFNVRSTMPDFFCHRDPTSVEITALHDQILYYCLPHLSDKGHNIHIVKLIRSDSFSPSVFMKYLLMKSDVELLLQGHHYLGDEMVFDLVNVPMNILFKLTPRTVKQFIHCSQDAIPNRTKKIHIINAPTYIEHLLSFFKMFLKQKLQNRIVVHSTLNSFQEQFSKDILPEEYGGVCGTGQTHHDTWKKLLTDRKDYLMTQSAQGSNENTKKILEKCSSSSRIATSTDIAGSFKRLSLE